MKILVDISPGELLDKISILQIKVERIKDKEKNSHAEVELVLLRDIAFKTFSNYDPVFPHWLDDLGNTNRKIWDLETAIRNAGENNDLIAALAIEIYQLNDVRAAIKRTINEYYKSEIQEVKSHDI